MTVSKGNWQEFSSGSDTFEIRVLPGTDRTQGLSFILFNDIQDMFPGVTRLLNGKRMVGMMADAEGNRYELSIRNELSGCTAENNGALKSWTNDKRRMPHPPHISFNYFLS